MCYSICNCQKNWDLTITKWGFGIRDCVSPSFKQQKEGRQPKIGMERVSKSSQDFSIYRWFSQLSPQLPEIMLDLTKHHFTDVHCFGAPRGTTAFLQCTRNDHWFWLVVDLPPEKYMFVSWDDDIPMESNKIPAPNISKPPTRIVWHVRFLSTYLLGLLSKNSREMSWNPPTINDH